jgi:hypothetical protein
MPYARIVQGLAPYAGAHARNGFAPSEGNGFIAVFASFSAFALRDKAPRKLDSILNAVIDLILDRSVAAPSACHALPPKPRHFETS